MVSGKKALKKLKETLISQEISLVKILCDNEQSVRHRGVHKLTRWLTARSQSSVEFQENDFSRLWKGLFYCLWMADKPLYQEEIAELICKIVHCLSRQDDAILFIKSFFHILGQEWRGIDNLRMDKCMMLVRRLVRHSFFLLSECNWNQDVVDKLATCYRTSLDHIPDGLMCHLCDVYVNELAKVGGKKLNDKVILDLLKPFAEYMSTLNNGLLITHIGSSIFLNMIRLTDEGVEHESRFTAWRDRGFPEGQIDVIKKVECNGKNLNKEEEDDENDEDDDEMSDKELDPRAGLIDVELPTLRYDPLQFVDMFKSLKLNNSTTTKARKQIDTLIKKFTILSNGKYPLGLQRFELPQKLNWKNVIRQTADELITCEANDYCNINGNDCLQSPVTKNTSSMVTNFGTWKVTLVKGNVDNNKRSQIQAEPSVSVSSNWVVIDKRKDVDKSNNENNVQKNSLKRKLNDFNGSDNDSFNISNCGSKRRSKEKLTKLDEYNHNKESTCTNGDEQVLIIKQPKKNCRRKQKLVEPDPSNNSKKNVEKYITPPVTPTATSVPVESVFVNSSGKRKRVGFLLSKNTIQEESEYLRSIEKQPVVKFDGKKRPLQPIYKDRGVRSPINPFYKRLGFTTS